MSTSMELTRPLVLGIETSCDDTACALVDAKGVVHASVVSSQLGAHEPYGGVVPEIASREHLANWNAVLEGALGAGGIGLESVDAIAATRGPGLVGALLVGLSLGKGMARGLDRPFYGVHHLEGHVYSPFLKTGGQVADPTPERFVALVVSGGHTALYRVQNHSIEAIAETRDDAMGEVFDKVGKRAGLSYPQGPKVDEIAESASHEEAGTHRFSIARCRDQSLDFSFSGLKTETLRKLESEVEGTSDPPEITAGVRSVLAGFRLAAVGQIEDRIERLWSLAPFEVLAVSGGAAANRLLRRRLEAWAAKTGVDLRLVPLGYSGDNAAMIAHAALRRFQQGDQGDSWDVEAESRVPLGVT